MPAFRLVPATLLAASILVLATLAACVTSDDKKSDKSPGIAGADTMVADVSWSSAAVEYRGQNERRIAYECPADGYASPVWGTDIYTDDSSVCNAAVHAGKITREAGGGVVIEIRPGEESYASSTRNGVTSSSWSSWNGSFIFP